MTFEPIIPPERQVWRCVECGTRVSAIYLLATDPGGVCPKCGGVLEYDEAASIRNIS